MTEAGTGTGTGSGVPLGLLVGFEPELRFIVELARKAEAAGFASIHVAEANRNGFVTAAAIAAATERIRIGTYVVNAYARDPWLTGLAARDLHELSGGRFVLGVGTGNRHLNQWYLGVDSAKPWAKMRDYVTIVRQMVAAPAGASVHYDGPVHQIRWRAPQGPGEHGPGEHGVGEHSQGEHSPVPVYLSASGPKMVRVAGEVADGVGVGIMSSTRFLADIVRPRARAACEAVGRDPAGLAFPMAAQVSVHDDEEVARAATRLAVCGLFHPVPHPYYDSQLRQLGFEAFADAASELMPGGRTREAMAAVPDEVIDTMTITGTPARCAARLADYRGLADEVIAFRVPQRGEPAGLAAYESLLALAAAQAPA